MSFARHTEPALIRRYVTAVRADDTFGQQLGVPGTPAFPISGKPVFGAQPLAASEAAIAQARRGQLHRPPAASGHLLAIYAAGMTAPLFALAAPLFALAATWDRLGIGHRRWLRGKGILLGPLRPHTNSVLSGLIFTGLGVIFLRYQGTTGLTGLLAPSGLDWWNNRHARGTKALTWHKAAARPGSG